MKLRFLVVSYFLSLLVAMGYRERNFEIKSETSGDSFQVVKNHSEQENKKKYDKIKKNHALGRSIFFLAQNGF